MAEWIQIFLVLTPFMAWFFVGVGVPWALAILPRHDWQDRSIVFAVGLALGPLFGTLWLFLLGTFFHFSVLGALGGTIAISCLGMWLAWRRWQQPYQSTMAAYPERRPFIALERILWLMMTIGFAACVWDTAFWPFLRYDTLWTFGYNARVFILEDRIPTYIDYYPQLVPLTFTYGQLIWGEANDHAARAAVPWFILSSALSAYVLGWRVYGQRIIGTLTAALWLLTPSVLVWASSGDLEHVMPIYFTLAAVFIVLAWRADDATQSQDALRYAILSGLALGGAMWTKPTSGAFVFGMAFIALGALFCSKDWQWRTRKLWLLVRVGLVAAPIGGVWYVRNVLLGHAWTNLPPAYWQDFAQRSGMQLDTIWIFVTLTGLIAFIQLKKQKQWRHFVLVSLGILAINVAILPTLLSIPKTGWTWQTSWDMINGFREANRRLYAYEGFLLLFGVGALGLGTWPLWRQIPSKLRVGFLLTWALGLPFFLVYFWSFSYHYRLMLTVLPIMLAAIAALLAYLLNLYATNTLRRIALVVIAVFLGLPAPIAASFHTWHNTLDARGVRTETDKYRYANPALMDVVAALDRYAKQQERDQLRVLAPGENRLAFFFPTWHIDDETIPTDLEDLNGYDVFVYSVVDFLWRAYDFYPNQVQAWTKIVWEYPLPLTGKKWAMDGPLGLPLPRFLRPIMTPIDDGTFHYELFAIDIHAPYTYIQPTYSEDERIYSTQMQLLGYDVPTMLFEGESYVLKFYWRGGAVPPQGDYSIFVHLTPPDDPTHILAQADGGFMVGAYPTRFLTPNVIFQDRRILHIPNNIDIQKAVLRVGVYDPATGIRFPILLEDGQSADSLTLQPILTLEDK